MKKIIIIVCLAITATGMYAQSAKFHDAMSKSLTEMDTCKTDAQFMAVANKFERIALAEKNQWLPYYYAALARTTATFMTNDKNTIDATLDVAQKFANAADSLEPKNSEITLLKSMILLGRISVDPMTRGMQFGMQSAMLNQTAMQLDPSNPRTYLIMGQSLFYTPEQFGGGKAKACPQIMTAIEKYKTFTPASDLHPNWGKEMAEEMMKQCGDMPEKKD